MTAKVEIFTKRNNSSIILYCLIYSTMCITSFLINALIVGANHMTLVVGPLVNVSIDTLQRTVIPIIPLLQRNAGTQKCWVFNFIPLYFCLPHLVKAPTPTTDTYNTIYNQLLPCHSKYDYFWNLVRNFLSAFLLPKKCLKFADYWHYYIFLYVYTFICLIK